MNHAERLLEVIERDIRNYESDIRSAEHALKDLRKERNQLLRDLSGAAVTMDWTPTLEIYNEGEDVLHGGEVPVRLLFDDNGNKL